MSIKIVTESTCDLPQSVVADYGISHLYQPGRGLGHCTSGRARNKGGTGDCVRLQTTQPGHGLSS